MRKIFLFVLCVFTLPGLCAPVVLSTVLDGYIHDGKVDYDNLRSQRREQLREFAASLALVEVEALPAKERIAFWLDAYNGLVIYQIVETGRQPATARERGKFFRGTRYKVAGRNMTLDEIEHGALRPLAEDPRVHFVLVCGANSCPPLQASSFLDSENLDERLEAASRDFINDPRNVRLDPTRKVLHLSRIFDWYKDDFGDVIDFVARYRGPADQAALETGDWKLEYIDYDWSLNEATKEKEETL